MLVECEIEISVRDPQVFLEDDHDIKLWIQSCFRDLCCYRISRLVAVAPSLYRALVAVRLTNAHSPLIEQAKQSKEHSQALKAFVVQLFHGKGKITCVSDPVFCDA